MSVTFFTDRNLGLKFPTILRERGLAVEIHADHFVHDCPDTEWLATVAAKGWVAVTHDARIRYKPNELAAVIQHKAALLVVVGSAPFPALARSFVATHARLEAFLSTHEPPFIAKVHRASPAELARNPMAAGHVKLWYPQEY